MKAASIADLKKELKTCDKNNLIDICLRLARHKKESKELLTYLIFEANDEAGYVSSVKAEMEEVFQQVRTDRNVYFIKKSLRKILRMVNRYVRYSGIPETELELRLFFCIELKNAKVPLVNGTVLNNIYLQQVKKINKLLTSIPEDLIADYEKDLQRL